jgi:hypothetical protein
VNDSEREELRETMRQAIAPVVNKAIADATRPYRRATFWLAIVYLVLMAASIAQWTVT